VPVLLPVHSLAPNCLISLMISLPVLLPCACTRDELFDFIEDFWCVAACTRAVTIEGRPGLALRSQATLLPHDSSNPSRLLSPTECRIYGEVAELVSHCRISLPFVLNFD